MPRPLARWVVVGALVVAFLTAIPVVSLGVSAIGQDRGPSAAPSETGHRLLPQACRPLVTCSQLSGRAKNPEGGGPADFQPDHVVAWSQFASPPAGFGVDGGMVANASSGEAVAFGGVSAGVLVNSTFVYTAATNRWSPLNPPTTPSPRSDFDIAFDPATGNATLFGGLTNLTSLSVSNQTWTYHFGSERWTLSTGTPAPPAREAAAFAIDPSLGVGFLFGGGVAIGAVVLALGLTGDLAVAFALMLGLGVTLAVTNIPINVVLQAKIPGRLLGRVGAAFGALVTGVSPAGPIFAGWLAQRWSVGGVFVLSGAVIMVVIGVGAVTMPSLRSVEY
ncbi:MAG: hypothetical protein ABR888_06245 [Thermoplasmata archaeon]